MKIPARFINRDNKIYNCNGSIIVKQDNCYAIKGDVNGSPWVVLADPAIKLLNKENRIEECKSLGFCPSDIESFDFVKKALDEKGLSRIVLSKDQVKNLLSIAQVDDTRYYANGVGIRDNLAIASDAKSLICCDIGEHEHDTIIPTHAFKHILSCSKTLLFEIEFNCEMYRINLGDWVLVGKNIHGKFPEFQSAMPNEIKGEYKPVITSDMRIEAKRCNRPYYQFIIDYKLVNYEIELIEKMIKLSKDGTLYWEDLERPVKFKLTGDCTGLIVPMKF